MKMKVLIAVAILLGLTISGFASSYVIKIQQSKQWKIALADKKVSDVLLNTTNRRHYNAKEGMEFLVVRLSIENLGGWTNHYTFKDVYLTDDVTNQAYSPLGLMMPDEGPYDDPQLSGLEIEMGSFFKDPIAVDAHQTITSLFETSFPFLVPKSSRNLKIRLCPGANWIIPLTCHTQPVEITK
jgi:hypothetical protein